MFNRYNKTQVIINNSESYKDFFNERKINFIKQYSTHDFGNLKFLQDYNLDRTVYTVQPFDRMYNISQKFYNSPDFAWLICYTNKIGSELEIKTGSILNIYFPLENLLRLF